MSNEQPLVPLSKNKHTLVQLGAICLTVSIACYGLALSTLIAPILEQFHAKHYIGIFSIFSSIGITIMTPIGGKLGDIFGRKIVVVVAGLACILLGVGVAYAPNLLILIVCRFGIGIAQGAFMAIPYIIVGLINPKDDIPKAMGYLAMALAIGGFGGSILAGALSDMGMLRAAILFPAIPLAVGVILIGLYYPNDKPSEKVAIDVGGILLLVATLFAVLLPLNGSALGMGFGLNVTVFAGGLILGWLLFRYEAGREQPIIPVRLFREKEYLAFLLIGFICYFHRGAMDVYAPLSAQEVMGTSVTISGSLQLPRTIVTILLPAAVGVWVAKKRTNMWKAMFGATLLAALPMFAMGFTTRSASYVIVYFAALAVTGIAESYRGVSVTTAAQSCLQPADIGVGTALVNFANALSGSISAAVFGAIYGVCTAADASDVVNIQRGVNAVFLTAGAVTLVGVFLVLFWVRPLMKKRT